MPSATIRISDNSRNILKELATQDGLSMQTVLEKAIEAYRRKLFLEEINKAYEAIRQDQDAWGQLTEDQEDLDSTLGDGLQADEDWSQNGTALNQKLSRQND